MYCIVILKILIAIGPASTRHAGPPAMPVIAQWFTLVQGA